jgi:5'-nucleotidase
VQGVEVGSIGMTLEGTPSVVTASGVAGLDFADEVETANRYAEELRAQGVETIIVLLHEGGAQARGSGVDECNSLTGPITSIVPQLDRRHRRRGHGAHAPGLQLRDRRQGRHERQLGRPPGDRHRPELDRRSGDVISATADNVPVVRTGARDAAQTELIARYRRLLGPIAGEVVGEATTLIDRTAAASGETPLGTLIADAQLAATLPQRRAGGADEPGARANLEAGPIAYERPSASSRSATT